MEQSAQLPYNDENVYSAKRLDFETYDMYRARRAYLNKHTKNRLKGQYLFVSSAVFKDGKRHTETYVKKNYEQKKEEEKYEEIHDKDK